MQCSCLVKEAMVGKQATYASRPRDMGLWMLGSVIGGGFKDHCKMRDVRRD